MSAELKNQGLASAEDIAIHFVPIDQRCETWYNTNLWNREKRSDGFYFRTRTTVHPDETLLWLSNCTSDVRDWTERDKVLVFRICIYAKNTPALRYALAFTAAELGAMPGAWIWREATPEA